MQKKSKVVYGTGCLSRKLGITVDRIKWLIRSKQIHPKKIQFGDVFYNVYSEEVIEEIKKSTGMN